MSDEPYRWARPTPPWLRGKCAVLFAIVVLCGLCGCTQRIAYQGDLTSLDNAIRSPDEYAYRRAVLRARLQGAPEPTATPAVLAQQQHKRKAYPLLGDYVLVSQPTEPAPNELVYGVRRFIRPHQPQVAADGLSSFTVTDAGTDEGRVVIRVDGTHALIDGANEQVMDFLRFEIEHSPVLNSGSRQ